MRLFFSVINDGVVDGDGCQYLLPRFCQERTVDISMDIDEKYRRENDLLEITPAPGTVHLVT